MAIIPKPRIVAFDFVFVSGYCPSIIFREAPYGSELYLNKFLFSRGAPIPKWLLKNILYTFQNPLESLLSSRGYNTAHKFGPWL